VMLAACQSLLMCIQAAYQSDPLFSKQKYTHASILSECVDVMLAACQSVDVMLAACQSVDVMLAAFQRKLM